MEQTSKRWHQCAGIMTDRGMVYGINAWVDVPGYNREQNCRIAEVYSIEANARLIANAPRIADEHADLLAALNRILDDKKPLEWSQTAEAAESFAAARVLLSDILTKEE